MEQKSPFRVLLELSQLLSPMELEQYQAAAAEHGRDLRDHTIALLLGKDRIPPHHPTGADKGEGRAA
jgi:hypothetical protein